MIVQKDLYGNIVNEYTTKAEAAKTLGLNESSIRRAISKNRTVLGRFKFVKIDNLPEVFVNKSNAKILIFDIETSPLRAYSWGLWQQNIYLDQILTDWFVISWAAKWLGEDNVMSEVLTSEEIIEEDDSRIVSLLWSLFDEASIVIAHNAAKFDVPKMSARFLVHGLMPPSSYKQIDTLQAARSNFNFTSNKLEALARLFNFRGKDNTSFTLWAECMKGNPAALKEMQEYNEQDVSLLEKVYIKLRPYIKGHPNVTLYEDSSDIKCPHCGSDNINIVEGKYFYTQSCRYNLYRCGDCTALSRSKSAAKFDNAKKVSSIPR